MFITMSDGTRYEVPETCLVLRADGNIVTPQIKRIAGTKAERQTVGTRRDTRKPTHRLPRLQDSEMNRRMREAVRAERTKEKA